jgi:uncharacterized protein (TIGR02118 family)
MIAELIEMDAIQEVWMVKLLVMYKKPKNAAEFDQRSFESHVPLAKKIPGLRKYEVSQGPVMTPFGPSGVHLVATLHFDDMAALQEGMGSAEGRAGCRSWRAGTHVYRHTYLRRARGVM